VTTLVIATGNAHKVGEIRGILGGGYACLTLRDFPGAPSPVEDAPTFAGNAAIKARSLAAWVAARDTGGQEHAGYWVLADDSGLEVDALGGAPGVHSARFAALDGGRPGNSPTAENNAKLLRCLAEVPAEQRGARFRCVLALARVTAPEEIALFEGACPGRIIEGHRGREGFGYDPLFIPDGYDLTFAELGDEVKNRISHRASAVTALAAWLATANPARPGFPPG